MRVDEAGPRELFESLKSGRLTGEKARLRAAASLLESSFYQELFKVMRQTVPEEGISGGAGEDMFASLMDQHVAEAAAAQSDRGIGAALYRHFVDAVVGSSSSVQTPQGESSTDGESGS